MSPNPVLQARYGTKLAESPALEVLRGVLGFGLLHHDQGHQEQLRAEAEAMNQALREREAMKMHATKSELKSPSLVPARVNHEAPPVTAEDAGLFYGDADLFKGGSASVVGRYARGELLSPMEKAALGGFIGAGLKGLGAGAKAIGSRLGMGGVGGALQAAGQGVMGAVKPAAKPLIGLGTKAKLIGGLGLAGAAYAGYKGLQTTRDYMMTPSYSSPSWGSGFQLQQQPNQYGY